MRKCLYVLFTVLTFYLAGRFRMGELLLLSFVEALLFLAMFAVSLYAKRSLDVKIHMEQGEVRKGDAARGWMEAQNRGLLPVPSFCAQLRLSLNGMREAEATRLCGYVPAKGAVRVAFVAEPRFCGILDVSLGKVEVRDYLSLFKRKKVFDRKSSEAEVLVVPRGVGLRMDLRECGAAAESPDWERIVSPGDEPPEVSQIQQYRPGDAMKDIHWKLTARNDQLLSKRYVEEERWEAVVYLNLFARERMSAERMDAFLELSSAVSVGLLEDGHPHRMHWYDAASGKSVVHEIESHRAYQNMIEELVRLLGKEQAKADESVYAEASRGERRDGEVALTVSTGLELLFWNGRAFRFSDEGHMHEIMEACVVA